jgi:hypothetical protein
MPIWLRNYTYNLINEFYENEKREIEKQRGRETLTANSKIPNSAKNLAKVNIPDFVSSVKKPKK